METASSLFPKKYDMRKHHFDESTRRLLQRFGLSLELLVELLRIDV